MTHIRCAGQVFETLHQHAVDAYPCEACGLLVGEISASGEVSVMRAERAQNLSRRPDRFEVDPCARLALQRSLRASGGGRVIVGHYHTHPDAPASPSAYDISRADEYGLVWLIASVSDVGVTQICGYIATKDGLLNCSTFVDT